MNITIRQLEAFLAAAKHESLVQAAEDLYLTKGAVSQALQELEQKLMRTLFICYHAKKYHSQSMDRFLNFCRVWQL